MKLSIYAKKYGITYRTAYRHFKQGKIPGAYQQANGFFVVPNNHDFSKYPESGRKQRRDQKGLFLTTQTV